MIAYVCAVQAGIAGKEEKEKSSDYQNKKKPIQKVESDEAKKAFERMHALRTKIESEKEIDSDIKNNVTLVDKKVAEARKRTLKHYEEYKEKINSLKKTRRRKK